jgi:hypothetical protein
MPKRDFKKKATYAPKRARLVEVGELLSSLTNQPSLNNFPPVEEGNDHLDYHFPSFCDTDICGLPASETLGHPSSLSCSHPHSATSSLVSDGSTGSTCDSHGAESIEEDPIVDGSYYVKISDNETLLGLSHPTMPNLIWMKRRNMMIC